MHSNEEVVFNMRFIKWLKKIKNTPWKEIKITMNQVFHSTNVNTEKRIDWKEIEPFPCHNRNINNQIMITENAFLSRTRWVIHYVRWYIYKL